MKSIIKIISLAISFSILIILVLSGPAQAFILNFSLSPFVNRGDIQTISISAEVQQGESLDIKNFTLSLSGPKTESCSFSINATPLSNCTNIKVNRVDQSNFSYGYAISNITLEYNASINSSLLPNGTYDARLTAALPDKTVETHQQFVILNSSEKGIESCSIRAKDGSAILNKNNFGNINEFTAYVPLKEALDGQGGITLDYDRNHASFKFDIKKAYPMDDNTTVFKASGILSMDKKEIFQEATIIYYKNTDKLDVNAQNLTIKGMSISFKKC
jgi:hypothetical protein